MLYQSYDFIHTVSYSKGVDVEIIGKKYQSLKVLNI